jgi:hypothetical protein
MEETKSSFEKLSDLQTQVGYKEGPINPVALLGLFGEAGEVLAEVAFESKSGLAEAIREKSVSSSRVADDLKKHIRDKKNQHPITVVLDPSKESLFDKEMADTLYYLNALAICRGKTLEDYAEISYQKCLNKTWTDISHATDKK